MISGLDMQAKFKMFSLFSGRHIGVPHSVHQYGDSILGSLGKLTILDSIGDQSS